MLKQKKSDNLLKINQMETSHKNERKDIKRVYSEYEEFIDCVSHDWYVNMHFDG
jgi:hypothetical protein